MLRKLRENLQLRVTFYTFMFIIILHGIFFTVAYSIYSDYVIEASVHNMEITTIESARLLDRILARIFKTFKYPS